MGDVEAVVRAYLGGPETRILRVRTESGASHEGRARVARAVVERVLEVLG